MADARAIEGERAIKPPVTHSRRTFLKWLGGLGAVGLGTYALHRSGILGSALEQLAKRGEVPQTFDNNATSGVIGDNNTVTIPLAEIQKQFPEQFIEKDNTISFLFPFQTPEGSQVSFEKTLTTVGLPQDTLTEANRKGIKDNVTFSLPKDTVIIAPANSHVLAANTRRATEDQSVAEWTRLFYYDESKDITTVLWFVKVDEGSVRNTLYSFIPAQTNEPTQWRDENWQKLPEIEQGTPILRTVKNQRVELNVSAYKGKVVGPKAEITNRTYFAVTPQFFTASTAQGEKILVLSK